MADGGQRLSSERPPRFTPSFFQQTSADPFRPGVLPSSGSLAAPSREHVFSAHERWSLNSFNQTWNQPSGRGVIPHTGSAPQQEWPASRFQARVAQAARLATNMAGEYAESLIDLLPIIGSMKGIYEAYKNPTPIMILAATMGMLPLGGGVAGKALKYAAKNKKLYEDLVSMARKLYPLKAGKKEKHHITPKYLGGSKNGEIVELDAAYHQLITNEFRELHGYGTGKPTLAELERILDKTYAKIPLPPQGY